MDIGGLFLIAVGAGLALLVALALRKMWRGDSRAAELPAVPEAVEPEPVPPTTPTIAIVTAPVSPPVSQVPPVSDEERQILRAGLAKTRSGLWSRLSAILRTKELPPDLLDRLEETLITADVGVKTTQKLLEAVRTGLSRDQVGEAQAVLGFLREEAVRLLSLEIPPVDSTRASPFVILVVGVNGTGKTTTIGKLAARFRDEGRSVVVAAGDTFRAAAVEQLEVWASRAGAVVVKGKEGADPSSVAFDAVKRAQAEGIDVVIADTAGRLHTKVGLMEELQKVRRVLGKAQDGAPHETWLVLDATTGQNAVQQARMFKTAIQVTGTVLTKLDGTAKGGVILAIAQELALPVRFVGVGERAADLRPFNAHAFADALFGADMNAAPLT